MSNEITTIKASDKVYSIVFTGSKLEAQTVTGNTTTTLPFLLQGLNAEKKTGLVQFGSKGNKNAFRLNIAQAKYELLQNALCGDAAKVSETVAFEKHVDDETGIAYYTLKNRISRGAWQVVAHLFQSDVELDCPSYNSWNDSVTLRWATRQPEKVAALLA